MKKTILMVLLMGSLSAQATQYFHCESTDGRLVDVKLNSLTEIEYSNDWDFDGTYQLASQAKVQMWNSFKSSDEDLSNVEIQIQGKLFHGKPGLLKEISRYSPDDWAVFVFKCAPGKN